MGTHDNDIYVKAIQAEMSITGRRWCSNCQLGQKAEDGEWIVSANGRQRRWICQACLIRKKNREKR